MTEQLNTVNLSNKKRPKTNKSVSFKNEEKKPIQNSSKMIDDEKPVSKNDILSIIQKKQIFYFNQKPFYYMTIFIGNRNNPPILLAVFCDETTETTKKRISNYFGHGYEEVVIFKDIKTKEEVERLKSENKKLIQFQPDGTFIYLNQKY